MNHWATPEFWQHYRRLPDHARSVADKNFSLLSADPHHPSLRLKKVGQYWSVRAGLRYRALAKERSEGLVWFWIGPHNAYEELDPYVTIRGADILGRAPIRRMT